MFGKGLPVLRLSPTDFRTLAANPRAKITSAEIKSGNFVRPISANYRSALTLSTADIEMLDGTHGVAVAQAMQIICAMAANQGAERLIDVTQSHIDGCIYASPANLTFAEKMAEMGARVRIPTTMNAISVDLVNWKTQGTPPSFGNPAARLADAYVRMGCRPSFTCSPYLLDSAPTKGEAIGWAESNAVALPTACSG